MSTAQPLLGFWPIVSADQRTQITYDTGQNAAQEAAHMDRDTLESAYIVAAHARIHDAIEAHNLKWKFAGGLVAAVVLFFVLTKKKNGRRRWRWS